MLAKPPWLKPGVYVEYEIRDAYATNITICADLGTLVELGLVHKFEVNGCVIVTDLEFDELVERLRRAGQWPPRGAGLTILSSRLYRQVLELYRAGKLPKVVREGSINYGIGGFDIINATYYWRCVGFEKGLAVLEVGFRGWVEVWRGNERVTRYVNETFVVYVDPDTREAYTRDGKLIGVVPYWASGFKVGGAVTVLGIHGVLINGTVFTDQAEVQTPLGTLKAYAVIKLNKTLTFRGITCIYYDRVYGILLSSHDYGDPVLAHFMNVTHIHFKERAMVISKLELPPAEGEEAEGLAPVTPTLHVVSAAGAAAVAASAGLLLVSALRRRGRRGR